MDGSYISLDCGVYFVFTHPFFDDRHFSAWFCVHLYVILGGQTVHHDAKYFMFLEHFSSLFWPLNLCSFYFSWFYFNKWHIFISMLFLVIFTIKKSSSATWLVLETEEHKYISVGVEPYFSCNLFIFQK